MDEAKINTAVDSINQTNELLFVIYNGGKEYRIYTSGRVEGFEGNVGIFNRFPILCADLLRVAGALD